MRPVVQPQKPNRNLPKNKKLKSRKPAPKADNDANDGGPNKKKRNGYFGAVPGTGYKGVSRKKVRRLVNGVIREEVRDLKQQRNELRQDTHIMDRATRRDYQRGVGDLNYVHGETADYLNNLSGQSRDMWATERSQANAAASALSGQIGSTYSGAMGAVDSEMARLGIQGGAGMQDMVSNQAYGQTVAAQNAANTDSNFGYASANSAGLMSAIGGMNQGSLLSGIGSNLNNRNEELALNHEARRAGMRDVNAAINEARGSRSDIMQQLLTQLQQTGWSQFLQADALRKQNQDRRRANGGGNGGGNKPKPKPKPKRKHTKSSKGRGGGGTGGRPIVKR